jgi:hypothetical protein
MCTKQQSDLLCNAFLIWLIFHWYLWFVQRRWIIQNALKGGLQHNRTKRWCSSPRDSRMPQLEFTTLFTMRMEANWSNPNDSYSDRVDNSSTFRTPDLTNLFWQQEDTNTLYTRLSYMRWDIGSITAHEVGVAATDSTECDMISWSPSQTTARTLYNEVVIRHISRANDGLLARNDAILNRTASLNAFEMKWVVEQWWLPRMAKVHNIIDMRQGS